ncbi:MBL fold metallo-hydrolase [bacterium]|nr:MBL fold metallo-hydrolase [bacterium]
MLKNITVSKVLRILECVVWVFCGVYVLSVRQSHERIVIFDVGQGDSILIQKGDFEILVDGGEDDTVVYRMGEYMEWDDRVIDVVVITHMHSDHYMGIKYLLESYEVGLFVLSVNCTDLCSEFREFNHIDVSMGDTLEYGGIHIDILWPRVGELDRNLNNDSIVMLVEWLDKRVLLMGDAEVEVEKLLLEHSRSYVADIDILKAGHHCSKTASSYGFLITTSPKFAICSCGEENRFGHPHIEALDNFVEVGVPYILTWEYGDYIVE